jgi:hypothetical protein
MESFASDFFAIVKEVLNVPPDAVATYFKINLHPFTFFNNQTFDWNLGYFGTGIGIAGFVFCFALPAQEYSKNRLIKWLIQIPVNKVKGLVSKGAILFISLLWLLPSLLSSVPFLLFSGGGSMILHLKSLVYCVGTVCFTVSFILMGEYLVMAPMKSPSILRKWKNIIEKSKEEEAALWNNTSQAKEEKEEAQGETFFQLSNRVAKFGVKAAAPFWPELFGFQRCLVIFLVIYCFVYPLFCLSIVHI